MAVGHLSSKSVTLMAIDPGYDRVGWAIGVVVGKKLTPTAFGLIQTSPDKSLIERYAQIDTELCAVIEAHHPAECAIESLFFFANKTTAMHVAEARGVIISCLFRHAVRFAEYTPLQIKQAVTGYGRADKKAVEKMVRMQMGKELDTIAKGSKEKIFDDTLDALALLLTHGTGRTQYR